MGVIDSFSFLFFWFVELIGESSFFVEFEDPGSLTDTLDDVLTLSGMSA